MFNFDVTICQIVLLLLFFHLFFLIALRKKRNDVADIAWGLGFILLALVGVIYNPNTNTLLLLLLVSLWGLRLAWHIGNKFKRSEEEDLRYAKWRGEWGVSWKFYSWFKVFMLQAFFLLLVAMPLLLSARFSSGQFGLVNMIGVFFFFVFWSIEIIADRQLKGFLSKKDGGKIMKKGLWRYSRHPNYFGEAGLWWGIWLSTWGIDYFFIGIIGPITIYILLRYISGVPLAEVGFEGDEEYEKYKRNIPPLVPFLR